MPRHLNLRSGSMNYSSSITAPAREFKSQRHREVARILMMAGGADDGLAPVRNLRRALPRYRFINDAIAEHRLFLRPFLIAFLHFCQHRFATKLDLPPHHLSPHPPPSPHKDSFT